MTLFSLFRRNTISNIEQKSIFSNISNKLNNPNVLKSLGYLKYVVILFLAVLFCSYLPSAFAAGNNNSVPIFSINLGEGGGTPDQISTALKVMAMITILSIAPALVIALTSFTRTVIVFSFLRQALGVPQVPPNQVLIGLSLFITYFVMSPVIDDIYGNAYQPYVEEKIGPKVALNNAAKPIKTFMLKFTREKDLALFLNIANIKNPNSNDEIPLRSLVPAFMISELKTSFQIGFMIYVPFLVIDMIVSTVLLAMGMMVLPPMLISLPLKLMLFVLVDGWNLVVESLVRSFQ